MFKRSKRTKEKNHQLQANLEKPLEKMASFCIAKITSRIKGHHHYNYKYKVGEELECLREPENEFSKHAISVNTEQTERNEQKRIVGHNARCGFRNGFQTFI